MSHSPSAWRRWLLLIFLVVLAVVALSFLIWPDGSFPIGRPGGSVVQPTIKETGT